MTRMDLKHVTVASVRVDPMKLIVLNEAFGSLAVLVKIQNQTSSHLISCSSLATAPETSVVSHLLQASCLTDTPNSTRCHSRKRPGLSAQFPLPLNIVGMDL
jgi:hypothetical protein